MSGNSEAGWRTRTRRGCGVLGVVGLGVGVTAAMASASASGPANATPAASASLASPHALFTGRSFAANSSAAVVVIGASTTVPTDATTVVIKITAGGPAAGSITVYPTGNPATVNPSVSWTSGGTSTITLTEHVGASNEVTFANHLGTAKASASLLGYSTDVTETDVSATGGTAGQVLTNIGSGARWETPAAPSANNFDGSGGSVGDSLVNAGGGASWQPVAHAYDSQPPQPFVVTSTGTYQVSEVPVPHGDYAVTATFEVQSPVVDEVECAIVTSPGGHRSVPTDVTTVAGSGRTFGMVQVLQATSGGPIDLDCHDSVGNAVITNETMIATSVNPGTA